MSHLPTYANLKSPWQHKRHLLAHWFGLYAVAPLRLRDDGKDWIRYYCVTCGILEQPERLLFPSKD